MTDPGTTRHVEEPVFFESGRDTLFGVVTSPSGTANGIGVVLLNGGAWIPSINRNRMWVKVARQLAGRGYHVIRFEYHGCGESSGRLRGFGFGGRFISGVEGAASILAERGVRSIVLVGACFGGRLALRAASRIEHLTGLILISPPVYDYERANEGVAVRSVVGRVSKRSLLRQLINPERFPTYRRVIRGKAIELGSRVGRRVTGRGSRPDPWVGSSFLKQVRGVVRRRIPVLFVWGDADPDHEAFREARSYRLGELERLAGERMKVAVKEGPLHLFLEAESQDWVIQRSAGWLEWIEEATRDELTTPAEGNAPVRAARMRSEPLPAGSANQED